MIRHILLAISISASSIVFAQKNVQPTDSLFISGEIKNELILTAKDFDKLPAVSLNDIVITNHLGEPHGTAKNIKGVLLKTLLDKIEFKAESPKVLSQFYLVFVASDNYKVVFSWNEIYNTETGNNLYIITEKDGKKISDTNDRILSVSAKDFKTGRRYIKGLSKIIIKRVD